MPVTLSLAMIVKDEEALIARVLDSAAPVCDEMVVIDTGSSDATPKIAAEHGATVHEVPWRDDFATARNASFAWCNCDWILWLDADDVLPEESRQIISGLKGWLHDGLDVVVGLYHYDIAEDGTVLLQTNRERLIRRESGLRWEGKIHEVIPIPTERSTYVPDLVIKHRPDRALRTRNTDRNLRILEKEVATGHARPRTLFYYANELYDHQLFDQAARAYSDYLAVENAGNVVAVVAGGFGGVVFGTRPARAGFSLTAFAM
jgi:glycosyltransferase involved in cell wall biosynthesis